LDEFSEQASWTRDTLSPQAKTLLKSKINYLQIDEKNKLWNGCGDAISA